MNAWLATAFELRLLLLALLGAAVGGLVNWATYSLCWNARPLSPWSRAHPRDAQSGWADRLPVWGWWRLRRMQKEVGYDFWIRPLVVELCTTGLFAWLYWWEIGEAALVFPPIGFVPPGAELVGAMHAQYALHVLLFSLMLAVSLIDIDEQSIPDEVTLPGTLAALLLAVLLPQSRLIDMVQIAPPRIDWLQLASPQQLPAELAGDPFRSLEIALFCLWIWCVGLLPRPWRDRHGWRRALAVMLTRIARDRFSYFVLSLGVLGSAGIAAAWYRGGVRWESLLSSLVGLGIGGGLIWFVRFFGRLGLRREAMGFGDVTLMAMLGAFLGWQPALLIFFLAPFAGLAVGLVKLLIRRSNEIPYGPFLCLAAGYVIIRWPDCWERVHDAFGYGWLVPAVMVVGLVILLLLLLLLGLVKRMLGRRA